MYNAAIHAQQVLGATILSVSISETTDDGITYPLASAMSSTDLLASSDEDPLWVFLEQVRDCLSRALGQGGDLWRSSIERDRVDGGWGGAGHPEGPERSEDDHA
jgi:hypothetical protein